jgi:chromosome segregation ATPase
VICTNCHAVEASVCVTCAQKEVDGARADVGRLRAELAAMTGERDDALWEAANLANANVEAQEALSAAKAERDEARAEAKHYEGVAQRLQDVLTDTPENVERIARVAASTWDGGCRVVAWHVLNALALAAKLDEPTPTGAPDGV